MWWITVTVQLFRISRQPTLNGTVLLTQHPVHILTLSSLVRFVHVHDPFVHPKVRVTYSKQCKTIISFRAPLNTESVPGLLLCDSAAGTSHGNPTPCVFLTYEGFVITERISSSLPPPSGSDGNSSTSGPHLYSSYAAVPLPLSTVQLFSSMNKHL